MVSTYLFFIASYFYKIFQSSQEAESSLFFYKSIKKYSKHTEQLVAEDLRKLQFLSDGNDGGLTCDDFSKKPTN